MISSHVDGAQLIREQIRRVEFAHLGLVSLQESDYISSPGIRELSILESKEMIKFGVKYGHMPQSYLRLLEINDAITLRAYSRAKTPEQIKSLNENLGVDVALSIGQLIPGVKTVAGIAGVAYYAYQAYDSFSSGSVLGGAGNLLLTLLSAAAIEPLGATSFLAPVIGFLGPVIKLGKTMETFMGLIIKGAFGPAAKFLGKVPGLKVFVDRLAKGGMGALEGAAGWLGKSGTRLAGWLEQQSVKYASKAATKTPQGILAEVGTFLAGKVSGAAQTLSKFVTNLKLFITSGGKAGLTHTMTAAEAQAAVKVSNAAATDVLKPALSKLRVRGVDSKVLNLPLDDFYALVKTNKELAAKVQKAMGSQNFTKFNDLMLQRTAAQNSLKAAAATGEAAAGAATSGATVAAGEAAATQATSSLATPGALRNLGSAVSTDLASIGARLDTAVGTMVTKAEAAQVKSALDALKGSRLTSGGETYFFNLGGSVSKLNKSGNVIPKSRMTAAEFDALIKNSPEIRTALVQKGVPNERLVKLLGIVSGNAMAAGTNQQFDTSGFAAQLAELNGRFERIRLRRQLASL